MPGKRGSYKDSLRLIRSLLIVTSLREEADIRALEAIRSCSQSLKWKPLSNLMIDQEVWTYATSKQEYDPRFVFCHPDVLIHEPRTSLYYRGLCALSLKAAREYFGAVDNLENGKTSGLSEEKALQMARTYNTLICSIIKNSADWTLENGRRTVIATLGITLDGIMRNRIGDIAEKRVRVMVLEWLVSKGLVVEPRLRKEDLQESLPSVCTLRGGIVMRFAPEPDISFSKPGGDSESLLAVVEIKGGVDPAGALERYGAATKSFQNALTESPHCQNFFLSAVFTPELKKRIRKDRLVAKAFDIVDLLENSETKREFLEELFHYTLRVS